VEIFYQRSERQPRWFKTPTRENGKDGAGMKKNQQDVVERRDGSAA